MSTLKDSERDTVSKKHHDYATITTTCIEVGNPARKHHGNDADSYNCVPDLTCRSDELET